MHVLIRFRTGHGTYAVPIERTLEVRSAATVVPLPVPAPGVAGVVERGDTTVPVVSVLGAGARHVVVVTDGSDAVGVVAEEVFGVARVPDGALGPPPPGQEEPLVEAVVREDGSMTFVVDVLELVRHVRDRELHLLVRDGDGGDGVPAPPGDEVAV